MEIEELVKLLSDYFKSTLIFKDKKWYLFLSSIWLEVESRQVRNLVIEFIERSEITPKRNKFICKLSSNSYWSQIEGHLEKNLFSTQAWNPNKSLFACGNGVLDFQRGIFRPDQPEDRLTVRTDVQYREYFWESKEVLQLLNFFGQVFPVEQEREQFYDLIIDCMQNKGPRVVINYGQGNNGRSTVFDFLQRLFGEYAFRSTYRSVAITTIQNCRLILAALDHVYPIPIYGEHSGTVMYETNQIIPPNYPIIHYRTTFTNETKDKYMSDKLRLLLPAALWFFINRHFQKLYGEFKSIHQANLNQCLKELSALPPGAIHKSYPGGIKYFKIMDRLRN